VKNLIIIGAGGYGREILMLALDNPACGVEWRVKGFLDNRSGILDGFVTDPNQLPGAVPYSPEMRERYRRNFPVLGDPLTYVPQKDDIFVAGVGEPGPRREYSTPLIRKGAEFIILIHPRASVSVFATMGRGCIVGPFCAISPDAHIGEFVTINSYTGIAHDVHIGDWCEIDGHCLIAGRSKIGAGVRMHAGSIITPDVEIGDNAVIGAGSVVFGRVPAGVTVIGNPARRFDWQ
jgi:sugar O-acyltransferase (sialic acid O-acetyltransferase NeuD family)